jgi:hypothetical protein
MSRPFVYIASPYTQGDVAINTHFQCEIFNRLLDDGRVWPVAPLWAHFQHTIFPRPYQDWVAYDNAFLHLYDACLRVNPVYPDWNYQETRSSGAENEVKYFESAGKRVFTSIEELYAWADTL